LITVPITGAFHQHPTQAGFSFNKEHVAQSERPAQRRGAFAIVRLGERCNIASVTQFVDVKSHFTRRKTDFDFRQHIGCETSITVTTDVEKICCVFGIACHNFSWSVQHTDVLVTIGTLF